MIDEIVCYIEEPPKIDCEIQQVKLVWENEHIPYRGETEISAIDCKTDKTFLTKGTYLDDNIIVRGHGLEQYGKAGEGFEFDALNLTSDLTLQTNGKYFPDNIDRNIVIKGHGLTPYEGTRFEFNALEIADEDLDLRTANKYLKGNEKNFKVKAHGLHKYNERPHEEGQPIVIDPSTEEQILATNKAYLDANILIKPGIAEYYSGPYSSEGSTMKDVKIPVAGYLMREDFTILQNLRTEEPTVEGGDSYTIYIH